MAIQLPPERPALRDALTSGSGPLYRRLAAALEAAIVSGEHPAGSRLPPERKLASELGLSRVTVVSAYDLLRDAGLVERRVGSGTRVSRRPPGADPWLGASIGQLLAPEARVPGEYVAARDGDIAFSIATLPGLEDLASRASHFVLEELPGLLAQPGYEPAGLISLRTAVAARYAARGLPTHPDQIVITTGAQHAIDLVVRLIMEPGGIAVVDDPTYPGALDALRAAGARVVGVPVDAAGMRTDLLEDAVRTWQPSLIYVVATNHNPTGVSLSDQRRSELLGIARRFAIPVVDDAALAGLELDGQPEPPPLASMAPDATVITLGSVSKLLWGGLRVGWIRAPRPLARHLIRLKLAADHGGAVVSQGIVAAIMRDLDPIIEGRRALAREGRDAMLAGLAEDLPEWRWTRPTGGLSLWARLPRGTAASLAELAATRGAIIVPGPTFSAAGGGSDRVRLPFGSSPEVIREGLRRLARAWADYRPMAAPRPADLRLVV